MNIIIWLAVGGLVGWAASKIMGTPEGLIVNIIVGIVGALVGSLLLGPLVGAGTINSGDFSAASLAVSLFGAVILLVVVNLVRRASAR